MCLTVYNVYRLCTCNLALQVLDGPLQELAEGHTLESRIFHRCIDLIDFLRAGHRRSQSELQGDKGSTVHEAIETFPTHNASALLIFLNEHGQQELVQPLELRRLLVFHRGSDGLLSNFAAVEPLVVERNER